MKTIVIGSGGREHAIAWALSKSPSIDEIVCIPGNGGTASENKCRNVAVGLSDLASVVEACRKELSGRNEIPGSADGSFIVVGPEDPLAAGLSDRLSEAGFSVVGPRRRGAALEASKDTAKQFMARYGVASASSETFDNAGSAIEAIRKIDGPVVIKADGLAAGKGVVVAPDAATAISAVQDFMVRKTLGGAGGKVVVEEYLEGEEVSVLAAVSVTPELAASGKAVIVPFVSARDHKRLCDGAKGPNTGGMGAIAPATGFDEVVFARFKTDILEPTLRGLVAEKFDYRGFIFFGVMVTKNGPKLLEYNVRLGDPETQAVLPLMDFDFASMCRSIVDGTLSSFPFAWKPGFVCAPVAVSSGYPGAYPKGLVLHIDRAAADRAGARIFIAGATVEQRSKGEKGGLVTSGGRVLSSSAYGSTVEEARSRAYEGLATVSFEGMAFRKDIGLPGAAVSGNLFAPK